MNVIILTAIAMLFYAAGEILSKNYANTGGFKFALFALLMYTIVCVLWLPTLQQKNSLTIMSTIWNVFYGVIGVILGIFVFKEHVNTYNYIGLFLALSSLYFLCK